MPINLSEFSFELDLSEELEGVPRDKHKAVKKQVGQLIKKEIESETRKKRSPVTGDQFQPLSKSYKALKKKLGKGASANLHLKDKMIKAIKDRNTVDGVKFEITQKRIIPRAFNNNTGDTIPERQFMPDEGLNEEFSPKIMGKVEKIIARNRDIKKTREVRLKRLSKSELEKELIDVFGKKGAQNILKQGFNIDELVDEILGEL